VQLQPTVHAAPAISFETLHSLSKVFISKIAPVEVFSGGAAYSFNKVYCADFARDGLDALARLAT